MKAEQDRRHQHSLDLNIINGLYLTPPPPRSELHGILEANKAFFGGGAQAFESQSPEGAPGLITSCSTAVQPTLES